MRFETRVMAALVIILAVLTQTAASALPYDPYPWCAQYSGSAGGGTNCGFLTVGQCQSYGEWYRGILCARSILQSGPSVCQAST
jgi:hypothetical protein